jgi:Fic family protein
MNQFNAIYEAYKEKNILLTLEEEKEIMYEYIYSTNKLEGNNLTLAQTKSIIEKGMVSGEKIKTQDLLEQKGTYKALVRMIKAVNNKEELSIELIKELNWLVIGTLYQDDSYLSYKNAGQQIGEFKIADNLIEIMVGEEKQQIKPLSNPSNIQLNMKMVISRIENSQVSVIEKASFLAQEIWLHQPFIDGNKRTARLMVNFLTMKEGYPLFSYENGGQLFNHYLVQQYIRKENNLIKNLIIEQVKNRMIHLIESRNKKQFKGHRFLI